MILGFLSAPVYSLQRDYKRPQRCQDEAEEPKEVPPEPAFAQDGWGYKAYPKKT